MNLFESMKLGLETCPDIDEADRKMNDMYPDPQQWADAFTQYQQQPQLYPNIGTLICSPYPEDNWGNVSGIMASFEEELRFPQKDDKIDPNRIYTSDIAALRSLAADQIRVKKLFEKRLTESLKDKDKYGLNENDIMAMQALTAANNAVTAINKEQIQIKKNIADIRLKQQQQRNAVGNGGNASTGGDTGSGYTNSSMIGRQMMDSIFESVGTTVSSGPVNIEYDNARSMDIDQAASILDNLIPANPSSTAYENLNPTTYVVVDQTGSPLGYETYDDRVNIIEDYDNPTTSIKEVDPTSMTAVDDCERQYPVKYKG
jgi:hypothetical protein